jgi:uncharacterized repeat protein (TIGR01451 family)
VTNNGPNAATGVTGAISLPAGLTHVSNTSGGTYNPITGSWTIGGLGAAATVSIQITANVNPGTANTTIPTSFTVSGVEPDPNVGNNSAAQNVSVQEAVADLAVSLSVSDTTPDEDSVITYQVLLTNNGPQPATSVSAELTLPAASLTYTASNPVGTYSSGVWSISGLTIAPGATRTLLITAQVNMGTAGQAITSTASATRAEIDPDGGNDSASITVVVAPPDLQLLLNLSETIAFEGQEIVYTFTLNNLGTGQAVNASVLINSGDVSLVGGSVSVTTGAYDDGAGTWTVGSLAGGATAELEYRATVDSTSVGSQFTAIGTASTLGEVNTSNNSASRTVSVPWADLRVTKTVDNNAPFEGDPITFTITVTNDGTRLAQTVEVTDLLPGGLSYVSHTETSGTYDPISGLWTIGALADGDSETLTIDAQVDMGMNGTIITNTASVDGTCPVVPVSGCDPRQSNNTANVNVFVFVSDLRVVKTVNQTNVEAGDVVIFTVVVANDGPFNATNVVATDVLPAGLTYSTHTTTTGTYNPGSGAWTIGSMLVGNVATLTLTASVDGSVTGTITNAATATSDQGDPGGASDSVNITVSEIDVLVTKTVDNPSPGTGTTVTFTITASNNGPQTATSVEVADALPAGLNYSAHTASAGSYNPGSGLWTVGTLANGASETLTLSAVVASGFVGSTLTNTASISAAEIEGVTGNNSASASVTVREVDLSISQTVDNPAPAVGETVAFTLTLTNNGPENAQNVFVDDLLPAGLAFVSSAPSAGTYSAGPGVWAVGDLVVGQTVILVITASVEPAALGTTITNTATIDTAQFDPNPANNSASAAITVGADLAVTKTVDAPNPIPGQTVTFTVGVSSAGPSSAAVTVTDLLPAGLTFSTSAATQGTYDAITGLWAVGTLNPGGSATLTITAVVTGAVGDVITNTATASSPEGDANPGDNSASAVVTVTAPSADLVVSVTLLNSQPPTVGEVVNYRVTVANNGPNAATAVSFTDLIPTELTYVSATTATGLYDSGTDTWTIGTLNPGAPIDLVLAATANPGTQGVTINHPITVSATSSDPNPGDNTGNLVVTIQSADLQLSLAVLTPIVYQYEPFEYVYTLTNLGPHDAQTLSVGAPLPLSAFNNLVIMASVGAYDIGSGLWTITSLANGASATLQIRGTVNTASSFTINGFASAATFDANSANNGVSSSHTPLFALNIDAGGVADFTEVTGRAWLADAPFVADGTVVTVNPAGTSIGGVSAESQPVHQSARQGMTVYSIPVPAAGNYDVTLYFAEIDGTVAASGVRVFDITVETAPTTVDFDIHASAPGAYQAATLTFTAVNVADGALTITFESTSPPPQINAILIRGS